MALQSRGTRQAHAAQHAHAADGTHAALVEIRDSLLETYACNDAMNQLILAELDPRAWRAQPPRGRRL